MELAQARIVTDDVEGMARFYARLLGISVTVNEYYVELPAGAVTIGFSKPRFTEVDPCPADDSEASVPSSGQVIIDLLVDDVDSEYARIDSLGVDWVMGPTTQPWGSRSMILRDPAGILINVFSRPAADPAAVDGAGDAGRPG